MPPRYTPDNPHAKELELLEENLKQKVHALRVLQKQIENEHKSARKWEKQNSPVKELGKQIYEAWQNKHWQEEVIESIMKSGTFQWKMTPDWILVIDAEKSSYSYGTFYTSRARLKGPNGKHKNTQMSGYSASDEQEAAKLFLPQIGPWAARMQQRP